MGIAPEDHLSAAHPIKQRDAGGAEEFNAGIKNGEGVDRVFVSVHVLFVQRGELFAGALLAVE